nr:immunoglobulin light chain junction region [Macaca mulatta]MOW15146.1 immunoglobulin light chain junction region [Macaca mulatta]MOW15155.1 immunoglobulin light chain junction region [Macaca mulatta]MOW15171.1 immunoglobulin light chain junction region [Macaca mulatta]MOW15239.1 immunoglobulin light chain junction region [Macaca mulatta]
DYYCCSYRSGSTFVF